MPLTVHPAHNVQPRRPEEAQRSHRVRRRTIPFPYEADPSNSGAGLGGLLLALVLQRDSTDIEVNIYEAHHELTEVGAGIGVWPRIWEILRYVGLEDTLKQSAGAARECLLWLISLLSTVSDDVMRARK